MKFLRRFFQTLLLLALIAAIAVQWLAGTAAGAAWFAREVGRRTHLEAEVGASRLSWCSATLQNLRLSFSPAGGTNSVRVVEAPVVLWDACGRGKSLHIERPEVRLVQSERGDWTPYILKELRAPDKDSIPGILSEIASNYFDGSVSFSDASLIVADASGSESIVCAGANFNFKPLRLKGHKKAAHASFSMQRFNGEDADWKAEWFFVDGKIILIDGRQPLQNENADAAAAAQTAPAAEATVAPAVASAVESAAAPQPPEAPQPPSKTESSTTTTTSTFTTAE